jgi:NADP-reducing hydrogenase subunit HndD
METISLSINDITVEVNKGGTILDAAKKAGIRIPTLCYHEDLCVAGNCRVCVVEQKVYGRCRPRARCPRLRECRFTPTLRKCVKPGKQ